MPNQCCYFKFILFVTGQGEKQYLPILFRTLSSSGTCSFLVKEFVPQLRPITSSKRTIYMVRTGQKLPDKDFERISSPARRYIQQDPCHRVLLIDDLENISEEEAKGTFKRYRDALNSGLNDELRRRAAVHFLVNMLEAYFFAHVEALNTALELEPPLAADDGDVEAIRHPKGNLKQIFPAYRETEHPGLILNWLDLGVVLSNPNHCASLRTCVKWIVNQIQADLAPDLQPNFDAYNFEESFHLITGKLYSITCQ